MITKSVQIATTLTPEEIELRFQELEAELAMVKRSLDALGRDRPSPDQPRHPCPAATIAEHRHLLALTAELFPDATIEVEEAVDPEIPGDPYLVINVATSGEVNAAVEKNRQWHRRLRIAAPATASSYRLSLDLR